MQVKSLKVYLKFEERVLKSLLATYPFSMINSQTFLKQVE